MDIATNWSRDMSPFNLYTIGYAGFPLDDFLSELRSKSIGAIIDVRSSPYSSRFEQFNITNIKDILNKNKIYYLFLGDKLGARPKDISLYTDNCADFEKMSKSSQFIDGCKRIKEGLNKFSVCIMCAEKDPATCHRTILVANTLRNLYPEVNIFHIHPLSKIEPQEKLDRRIMAMYDLEQEHFFKNFEERLKEAYSLRGKAIAYSEEV